MALCCSKGSTSTPYSFKSGKVTEVVSEIPRMRSELLTYCDGSQYDNNLAESYRRARSAHGDREAQDVDRKLSEVSFDTTRIGSSVYFEMRS